MTTATANPSFPDIHTKQDLPVDSYLRLTKSDVAKVYQHVHDDRGLSKLVIEFENIRDTFHDKLACYECLEGNTDEAKRLIAEHLKKHPEEKEQALADEDFTSIREFIEALPNPKKTDNTALPEN